MVKLEEVKKQNKQKRKPSKGLRKKYRQKFKVNIIQLKYKLFPAQLDVKTNIAPQLKKLTANMLNHAAYELFPTHPTTDFEILPVTENYDPQ